MSKTKAMNDHEHDARVIERIIALYDEGFVDKETFDKVREMVSEGRGSEVVFSRSYIPEKHTLVP